MNLSSLAAFIILGSTELGLLIQGVMVRGMVILAEAATDRPSLTLHIFLCPFNIFIMLIMRFKRVCIAWQRAQV